MLFLQSSDPLSPTVSLLFEKSFVFGLLTLAILYLLQEVKILKATVKELQSAQLSKAEKDGRDLAVLIASCKEALEEFIEFVRSSKTIK